MPFLPPNSVKALKAKSTEGLAITKYFSTNQTPTTTNFNQLLGLMPKTFC